jgi:acetoin utilization protein AcuB
MFIRQSMTVKVIVTHPEADIIEAKEKMDNHHIRHLPVIGDNNILVGIVTDRDIRSALPSTLMQHLNGREEQGKFSQYTVKDIMTHNPITISPDQTIQDALLLLQRNAIGALPVVDDTGMLKGIISVRDILRAFINVMGIGEPGILLCIVVDQKPGQIKKIVDIITEENILLGSILVAKYWEKNKRAVFPYLLTQNVSAVKSKLKAIGFTLLDPMKWYLDQLPEYE